MGRNIKKSKKKIRKYVVEMSRKEQLITKLQLLKKKKIDSISSESKKHDFSKLNSVLTTEKILKFEPSLRCVTELEHQR